MSAGPASAKQSRYVQTNLVSNNAAFSPAFTDGQLLNSWGIAFFPGSPFWINDNNAGVATLYDGTGVKEFFPNGIKIPGPTASGPDFQAAPTGIAANASSTFPLADGKPALFLFSTEDGTISGWNLDSGLTAELLVDNSQNPNAADGAVYKGLAIGENKDGVFLYATNFRAASVDVFGVVKGKTQQVTLAGTFTDPKIPAGFAPFGIANVHGDLIVTYAKQNAAKHDDVAGPGNGFVDIFDTEGNLIERFASHGTLNSPWGITPASFNFGGASADLLIGNFGDGRINTFSFGGKFDGQLQDEMGEPLTIDGLWSLTFGGAMKSSPDVLYFTAGPNGETDGLFGTLMPK